MANIGSLKGFWIADFACPPKAVGFWISDFGLRISDLFNMQDGRWLSDLLFYPG